MSSYEFYLNYVKDLEEKDRIAKLREEQDRKEKAEAEEERQRRNLELAKGIDGFEWSPGNRNEEYQEIDLDSTKLNDKELKQGLREIWEKEGRPQAKRFFPDTLKKYINKPGSPITEVYTSGDEAGISFRLSTGTTGDRTKKTIQNLVSEFKKDAVKKAVNSKK
jgi:hypothetical protein